MEWVSEYLVCWMEGRMRSRVEGEKQEIVGSTCALIGSSSAIAIRAHGAGGCISNGGNDDDDHSLGIRCRQCSREFSSV